MKKKRQGRLTRIIIGSKIWWMNMKTITPEGYEEVKNMMEGALDARAEQIRKMRDSDPEYWTFARLAKHWNTTRQNIEQIYNKRGKGEE